jgi:hypothetical protein
LGGTFSSLSRNLISNKPSYGQSLSLFIFKYPLSFPYDEETGSILPFYSKPFLSNFGLLYFLILPAAIYVLRKYFKETLFIIIVSFISFLIPFILSFNYLWQDTMPRFFYIVDCLWAIVVGIFLLEMKQKFKGTVLVFVIMAALLIIPLDGIFYQLTMPFYSFRAVGVDKDSFSGKLIKPTKIEDRAYFWVKENTTIKDYFLVFEEKENLGASSVQNYRFTINTQRLAPVYLDSNNYFYLSNPNSGNNLTYFYENLVKNCSPHLLKELNFKYLYVDNKWPPELEEKCLARNTLSLRFSESESNNFVRIYEVK